MPTGLTQEQVIKTLAEAGNTKAQEVQAGTTQIKPTPTSLSNPDGTVNAQGLSPVIPSLPEPVAPAQQQTFQTSLQQQIQNAQSDLETVRQRTLQEAIKRAEDLATKQKDLLLNPADDPLQVRARELASQQLQTAEQAVIAQREDFDARRGIVSELQKLLTEGNELISGAKARFASRAMVQRGVTSAMADVQARAGVLQATIAGLDGNIQLARQLIADGQNAVASVYQDDINYNNALLKIVSNKELTIDAEHRKFAEAQLADAEKKLGTLEKTSEYIQSLMIDPRSAKFMSDAGVSLNDSIEEINQKIAKQQEVQEINDTIRELTLDGYEYVPFGQNRPDAITIPVGGQMLSFVPPVDELRELQIRQMEENILNTQAQRQNIYDQIRARKDSQPLDIMSAIIGGQPSVSFEEYVAQVENQRGMSLSPQAREGLRREYNEQTQADPSRNLAMLVANGALSVQQANFIQDNLDIASPSDKAKQKLVAERGSGVLRDLQDALDLVHTAGPISGGIASRVSKDGQPAFTARFSPAFELTQHLDSIKSNISIEQLQAMREASPTGGALGQVPVQQQRFLMSVLGSLDPSLKPNVLQTRLNDVYNIYLDTMFGSPQELSEAVQRGRLSVSEANNYLSARKQSSFDEFGIPVPRSGGQDISNIVIAPDGTLVNIIR